MTLSTVHLKLVHQPLDQDKLYFYFGYGKWHSPIRCFPPLSQDCDNGITPTPCTHQTDSFVVDFIINRNLYDGMAFHFIQTSESLSSIQTHQSLVYFYSLVQSDTLPLWLPPLVSCRLYVSIQPGYTGISIQSKIDTLNMITLSGL
jgi:hypothetical protein